MWGGGSFWFTFQERLSVVVGKTPWWQTAYLLGRLASRGRGTLAQLVFSFSHVSLACTPAHELVLPAFQVGLSSESLETRQRHIQSCVSLMPWAFLNSVQLTIKN